MSDTEKDQQQNHANNLTAEMETEDDSGQAIKQRQNDKKINGIIKRIR